ncbi:YhdH/YhfP family quinone oxidoreductase [Cronobacter turicensis]|nr:YhdH/YhfP family quinone oxidoreductase [Cronobacter turicensis]
MSRYNAFVVEENNGVFTNSVQQRDFNSLDKNNVLIKVNFSSLNYKDALSASGAKFITKNFPHVTGIDAAGIVISSSVPAFKEGDEVIVTGFDLGMETDGGHAEYISVPPEWVVPLPDGLSQKQSMIIGTAGFTAGLSVMEMLNRGIKPSDGPVIVTGSSGGVGSVAIKILSKLGYDVHALSMSPEHESYLYSLGAKEIHDANEFQNESVKGVHLFDPVYSAVIDSVGGQILSTLIKKLKYGGIATTCGLVNGIDLDLSIFAFINRGIQVSGIDSVWIPMEKRIPVWKHLSSDWKVDLDEAVCTEITLSELDNYMKLMLNGKMKGRALVAI